MTRIGLIADTHHYLDETIFEHFKNCDEVWHVGDFGSLELAHGLASRLDMCHTPQNGQTRPRTVGAGCQTILRGVYGNIDEQDIRKEFPEQHGLTPRLTMLRGVYGNIDGQDIRKEFPEQLVFMCEGVKVMMRHIGGYPPKYNPETKKEILIHKPQLFISGHSHILKIMYDDKLNCLHMNPGAAGKQGWHKVRTIIRFVIDGTEMKDAEVIELEPR